LLKKAKEIAVSSGAKKLTETVTCAIIFGFEQYSMSKLHLTNKIQNEK
jgi:hypothetical protein